MNDLFRRVALGAYITVVALLPASLSAQVLVIPPASAVPIDSQRWSAGPIWRPHHVPPHGQFVRFWGMLQPLADAGATDFGTPPTTPEGFTILNGGIAASSSPGLRSGAGNGNGNGNIGSNNGNGNQTNGNGNFGVGDGVGNRVAPPSNY